MADLESSVSVSNIDAVGDGNGKESSACQILTPNEGAARIRAIEESGGKCYAIQRGSSITVYYRRGR